MESEQEEPNLVMLLREWVNSVGRFPYVKFFYDHKPGGVMGHFLVHPLTVYYRGLNITSCDIGHDYVLLWDYTELDTEGNLVSMNSRRLSAADPNFFEILGNHLEEAYAHLTVLELHLRGHFDSVSKTSCNAHDAKPADFVSPNISFIARLKNAVLKILGFR